MKTKFNTKLKLTTKLYIITVSFITIFRTVQIILLTETGSAFLKDKMFFINILGIILGVFLLSMVISNSLNATRQPKIINKKGKPSIIIVAFCSLCHIVAGSHIFVENELGATVLFFGSLLVALSLLLYLAAMLTDFKYPKIATLIIPVFWLLQLVISYLKYTEHPLRLRTIYEIFALFGCILFFSVFGKIICYVKTAKNFRLMYPLGLITSVFCFVSSVPEFIAIVFGFEEKITSATIHPLALFGAGVFILYFTLNTFKISNTFRPEPQTYITLNAEIHNNQNDAFS